MDLNHRPNNRIPFTQNEDSDLPESNWLPFDNNKLLQSKALPNELKLVPNLDRWGFFKLF